MAGDAGSTQVLKAARNTDKTKQTNPVNTAATTERRSAPETAKKSGNRTTGGNKPVKLKRPSPEKLKKNPDAVYRRKKRATIPLDSAEKFFTTFEKSARRWEMIVYPGMVIMLLFLMFSFYMIYNLADEVSKMVARFDDPQITTNLTSLSKDLEALNSNIALMAQRVKVMSDHTNKMSVNMNLMTKNTNNMSKYMKSVQYMSSMNNELKKMNQSVNVMNRSVRIMGTDMNRLRHDMSQMNRSVTRPLNFMNSFMPF